MSGLHATDPDNETPLTVGQIRAVMADMPDDAPAFVNGSPDRGITFACHTDQLLGGVDGPIDGPTAVGLELWLQDYSELPVTDCRHASRSIRCTHCGEGVAETEHVMTGRQSCTCGWEAPLGKSIWRAFDRHLLDVRVAETEQTTPTLDEVEDLENDGSLTSLMYEVNGAHHLRGGIRDNRAHCVCGWSGLGHGVASLPFRQHLAFESSRVLSARLADPALVEDMARAMCNHEYRALDAWEREPEPEFRDYWREHARAALAVVREKAGA